MDGKIDILPIYFDTQKSYEDMEEKLPFHNWMHTKTFFECVCYLGALENIDADNLDLLKVAALYHDRGNEVTREGHEEESIKMAREELPEYGLTQEPIDAVARFIGSTKTPTDPQDILEMIMCDSDMAVLGMDYFPYVSELLRIELDVPQDEWIHDQIIFLENHEYYTESAKMLFDKQKRRNLDMLKSGEYLEIVESVFP